MEKIDRELLIKEISSRLPYGVKAKVYGWDEEKGEVEVSLKIYSINTDGYVQFEANDYDIDYLSVDDCLLYLRPMSNMTESEEFDYTYKKLNHTEWEAQDYLNKCHFDYRGLIPMGLGIEAPEDMYNTKTES